LGTNPPGRFASITCNQGSSATGDAGYALNDCQSAASAAARAILGKSDQRPVAIGRFDPRTQTWLITLSNLWISACSGAVQTCEAPVQQCYIGSATARVGAQNNNIGIETFSGPTKLHPCPTGVTPVFPH
jgi:hypothetical protein